MRKLRRRDRTFTAAQRRTLWGAVIVGLLVFVAVTPLGHGDVGHFLVAGMLGLFGFLALVPACFAVGVSGVLRTPRARSVASWLGTLLFTTSIVGAFAVASIPAGCQWDGWRTQPTVAYVESLVPSLEAFREAHGEYPKELGQLPATAPDKPWFTRALEYELDSDGYVVHVGFLFDCDDGGPVYRSASGGWEPPEVWD
jgi:hypothetical protein